MKGIETMSSPNAKLFNYSRSLPPPFNKVSVKKVKVSSKYGDGTEATLCGTVLKAVAALHGCRYSGGAGALGLIDHRSVCEYKSAAGPEAYHLAVFDPSTGKVFASVYDKGTESFETYTVGNGAKARDGSAVMMVLLPMLLEDEEFKERFDEYTDAANSGFTDMKAATECAAVLCDNAYRRIIDEACPAHVNVKIDASGNLMRISPTQLDSGTFTPKTLLGGEFCIFAQSGPSPVFTPDGEAVDHSDFVGKYRLNTARTLSPPEQSLVPILAPWYILPEQIISVCKHALDSTGKSAPMRNFLLRGPAGTGKTEGARAIAAGLALPYMNFTCSANTEVFDFVGMVFPETAETSTGDADLDHEREMLKAMGGMTYANVARLLDLPGLDDMDYDPEGVYLMLTGAAKSGATSQDCMAAVLERVTEKVGQLSRIKTDDRDSGQTYRYTETDFIKAIKQGYLIEIQEPSTISNPGVLVGLNSLLEQTGSITLPTGEVIRRHPDAVVIITTNTDYEGCRGMNQSVLDRMNLTLDIELPAPEIMTQRAMSVTGCEDDVMVSQMVQVITDMEDYCRKNGITDGSCGMRSLIDWIISTEITGDPYTSALYTAVSKATANEEDRQALITSVLEPIFAPKRRKSA
jgi:hypothetical protein